MDSKIQDLNPSYTRQQWAALFLFLIVNIMLGMISSIQGPFFPAEAESKGLSASAYGFVFGIYHLTLVIVSPLLGSYVDRIGPEYVFRVGVVLAGSSLILFGFLDKIDGPVQFLTLALVLRVLEGIGASAVLIFIYSSIALQFPNSIATAFAQVETAFAIGFCVGPVLGEIFFQIGGYTMPFAVLGGIFILLPVVSQCLFVEPPSDSEYSEKENAPKGGMFNLVRIPTVFASLCGTFVGGFTAGFISNTLEHHIRQFNLSHTLTGFSFFLVGVVYAVTAPIFGSVCDHMKEPTFVTLVGAFFLFLAFLTIGPATFIPFKPNIWLTWTGLLLYGFGISGIFVSTFLIVLKDARRNGYPDSVATNGLVSGLWNSAFALGALLGPICAGVLQDNFGFRNASYAILALSAALILTSTLSILKRKPSLAEQNTSVSLEGTSLLNSALHVE